VTYRLIAQDILSGEFLDWDLPLSDVEVTYALSGPSEITGVFAPERANLNLAPRHAWSTWVHLEQDGLIRASGILQPTAIDGPTLKLSCSGPSAYPHGIPYLGDYSRRNVDPLDVVREIWRHVQSYPDSDLRVIIDDTTSRERLATDEKQDPYRLAWWDTKDCGQEIDNLARDTPFDYVETAQWNADHSGVLHHVRLGYPRIGRRLDNVRFAVGENVLAAVPLAEQEDDYASSVLVVGAGEGRERVRGVASERLDRVRRVAVVTDKSIGQEKAAKSLAQQELRRRQPKFAVDQITVNTAHPNAELGTFSCGDDVPVTGEFAWAGRVTAWHRVVAISWSPSRDIAVVKLRPSDAFRYGAQ
jgi:hypothetical protein